jgi:predicted nucleic acid-binding protein
VVIDSCVLIKASLRDTLIRAYGADLYRLHWSDDILTEVVRNLVENGMTTQAGAERLEQRFREVLEAAEVTGYSALIPAMTNHPKDRHVAAAAVAAGAQIIVTENLRDFPSSIEPFGIEAHTPDTFLVTLFDLNAAAMITIVNEQSQATHRPHLSVDVILDHLARDGASGFAGKVRSALSL